MDKVTIDNYEVNCFLSVQEAASYIIDNCLSSFNIAIAINPEKILAARKCSQTKAAIQSATIRYLDGMGVVKLASSRLGKPLARIPGCELWETLMYTAAKQDIPVFLLGAQPHIIEKTNDKLRSHGVNVVGYYDGFFTDDDLIIQKIKDSGANIVSVAMGSPKQELFMKKCQEAGLCCFMMGVGGTYNVFTYEVRRAPKFFLDNNLEWFYRLLTEPTRIVRQLKLFEFIYLCISKRI